MVERKVRGRSQRFKGMEFKKTLKKLPSITQPLLTLNQGKSTENLTPRKYGFNKCGNVQCNGVNMVSLFPSDFAYPTGLDVHLLQMQPTAVKRLVLQK